MSGLRPVTQPVSTHGVRCTAGVANIGASCRSGLRGRLGLRIILARLQANRSSLESAAVLPLAMSGVRRRRCATRLHAGAGEMLHLLLRLPGAAVHALEQKEYGHKIFPFFRGTGE
jgi:citrate synthase